MPRLRDDFFKSPVSLSNSSLNSSRKLSPLSKSPQEPQEVTETIVHSGGTQATPMPKSRPAVTFKEGPPEISSYSLSPSSQSQESYEEDSTENGKEATPLPRGRRHFSRPRSSSSPSPSRQGSPEPHRGPSSKNETEAQEGKESLAQVNDSKRER